MTADMSWFGMSTSVDVMGLMNDFVVILGGVLALGALAVAALIFIKSKNAEKLLSEFFEKARRDKQHLESRKICDLIENPSAKDALRIHLSLHFAEVEQASEISKVISDACLSGPDYKSQTKEFGF